MKSQSRNDHIFRCRLTVAALCAITFPGFSFAAPPATTETATVVDDLRVVVTDVFQTPTFAIQDGGQKGFTPYTAPCFETYVPETKYFRQFCDAGTRLFSFNTNAASCDYGHSEPVWKAQDTWDYSQLDERMNRVLTACPGARVILRVYIGTPKWWLDANPGEMEIIDDGSVIYKDPNRNPTLPKGRPFPSLASEKWRTDIGMALRKLIAHIQSSKYAGNIFGYFLAGLDTEEWYHWSSGSDQLAGYSPHMRKAFQQWLRAKYHTADALRAAWNNPQIGFDEVTVPSRQERYDLGNGALRDPAVKMNVIDFYQFYNDIIPETIDYFARAAKEATGGRKAVGAFYGYMYEFRGDPEYGHNALARYNQSKYLDFIFVTASYGNRYPGRGGDYQRAPAYSVRLHKKLWYHDNDVVSFLAPEVLKRTRMPQSEIDRCIDVLGYTSTPLQTSWMYERSMGFSICNGFFESYFDLHGGYYDHPDLMTEVARLNRAAETSKRYDRGSNSEILIVSDEPSCSYATFRSDLLEYSLLNTQWELIKIGAPADHILIDDLELLDTTSYKFVVFLNNYNMTDRQRALVEKKLKYGNKHLLWCYAPGRFNGNRTPADGMKSLTGFNIQALDPQKFIAPQVALNPDDPLLSRTAEHSGKSVVGPDKAICGLFCVDEKSGRVLGTNPGGGQTVFAMKDMGQWSSIYSITPLLPARIYRELARNAGVHIYNDRDDTLYANKTHVAIHANGAGTRTIKFPWPCDMVDIMTETPAAVNSDTLTRDFKDGETLILRWKVRL